MAKLLGQRSSTAWAGWTCKHIHRALPSRRQSLRAAIGSVEAKVLPLMRYQFHSRVKKVFNALHILGCERLICFSCEMKFSIEVAKTWFQPKQRSLLPNKILCRAADFNWWPLQERVSAQIPIKQHRDFRWLCAKAWQRSLAWFWIDSNQSLMPNLSHMNAMFESYIDTVCSFTQFSLFRGRRATQWALRKNCAIQCEVKIFQLQSMLNAIRSVDQRFAFKNSGTSCLALIFNLNNPRTTVLYAKKSVKGCKIPVKNCLFQET